MDQFDCKVGCKLPLITVNGPNLLLIHVGISSRVVLLGVKLFVCNKLIDFVPQGNRLAVFDVDTAILLLGKEDIPYHLKSGLAPLLIADQLIRELLTFIKLVVVDCHGDELDIVDNILVPNESFNHVFENELLRLDHLS
jgi:hypothetical protein